MWGATNPKHDLESIAVAYNVVQPPATIQHILKYHVGNTRAVLLLELVRVPNPECRALALLVLGNTSATLAVQWAALGTSAGAKYNVTNVYMVTCPVASGTTLQMGAAAHGAALLIISFGPAEACATAV